MIELDIIDKLQDEKGFVRLVLTSGEIVYGLPQMIVYEEDEEGWETVKTIMFEPYFGLNEKFYKLEEINSYEPVKERDIPPYE